jgi:hypothetical protein
MLKPETLALWNKLKDASALHGFVLMGGTALAMHLDHRVSEDLDFAWPAQKLPRARIQAIERLLAQRGSALVINDSPDALDEFEDSGLDLHDYQQNFIADEAVKLTFVAPDSEVTVQMRAPDPQHLRVAAVDEMFRLKCIACANRSKTRDWFDMYTLFERGLVQPIDMIEPFERSKSPQKLDIALMRMCSARPELGDEGYVQLLTNPPTLQDMQKRFQAARDEIEVELARRAALK